MSKFNLSKTAKEKGDLDDKHINVRLEEERTGEDQFQITEVQLDKDRIDESEVTIEKLLETKRTGSADKIIERNLNTSTSELTIKYRNPDTYEGKINKIEEKRLSGKKMEDEKYEAASEIKTKHQKWWENLLTAKAKSNGKMIVTARPKIVDPEAEEELDFTKPRWGDAASMMSEEEGLVPDIAEEEEVIDPTQARDWFKQPGAVRPSVDTGTAQIPFLEIKEKPIDVAGMKGLFLSFELGETAADEDTIKQQAYNTAIKRMPHLEDTDLSPDSFVIKNGWVSARLIGEQYIQPQAEGGSDIFSLGNVEEAEVGNDRLFIGTVNVSVDAIREMDDETLTKDLIDFLESQPELASQKVAIQPDALDMSKLLDGQVSFVGTKPMMSEEELEAMPAKKGRPRKARPLPQAAETAPAPAPTTAPEVMANSDFSITVLAQNEIVKKN